MASARHTQEHLEGIKAIKEAKSKGDLYGILGLESSCSDADIKKSYRKVSVILPTL
jgi:preprotein translocase subunit Sec63